MTALREDSRIDVGEESPQEVAPSRTDWPWYVAALASVGLLIGGGVWWMNSATVPVDDYDAVVAELEATEETLATARAELEAERSFVAELDREVGSLRDELRALNLSEREAELRARFGEARDAALLLGYFAGADGVVSRSWAETWAGVVALDVAVDAIDDPTLSELYWDHMDRGGGPVAEAADSEFLLLLVEHTVGPILEGEQRWSEPTR